jgi:hypothetical protein
MPVLITVIIDAVVPFRPLEVTNDRTLIVGGTWFRGKVQYEHI